jgi:branched-chain amino acid transport system permease protein
MKKLGKGIYVYLALVILAPLLFQDDYYLSLLVITGIYAIVAIGLSIVMGLTGQISIGQAAFWGIGAYTSAILTTKFEISPFLALIAAAIIPSVIAFILARAIAGLSGYYLAMATLAFGYIIQVFISEWESVTGGATGMIGIPTIDFFGDSELGMYYLVWGVVTIVLLFSLNLVESRVGRAFRAIHKSEIAATSMGIDVRKYRLIAFVVGGLFAGLSGGLYAHYMGTLDPQPFGFHESIVFITIVVIGGMTSIWGALVGTIIIEMIRAGLTSLADTFPALSGDIDTIVYGAILVLIIMFMPEGLVPRIQSMVQSFKLRRSSVVVQKNEERETVR